MKLVKALQIDINDGYNKIVSPEINKTLTELQSRGCTNLSVDQQGVDGRKCYVMISYDDPNMKP